jgi:hypothetical protein
MIDVLNDGPELQSHTSRRIVASHNKNRLGRQFGFIVGSMSIVLLPTRCPSTRRRSVWSCRSPVAVDVPDSGAVAVAEEEAREMDVRSKEVRNAVRYESADDASFRVCGARTTAWITYGDDTVRLSEAHAAIDRYWSTNVEIRQTVVAPHVVAGICIHGVRCRSNCGGNRYRRGVWSIARDFD